MNDSENQNGKRIGVHPVIVIFGVIAGLWVFIQAIIPESKKIQPPQGHDSQSIQTTTILKEARITTVPAFDVTVADPMMHAFGLLVPEQTTDSQVAALVLSLRNARKNGTLFSILPSTTPGNDLGKFSIANIFIFSDRHYAVEQAVQVLSIGAHAPGDLYGEDIPYEVAMEHVRGHYMVNLNNKNKPERGSLGYGEEATGLYSRRYIFLF